LEKIGGLKAVAEFSHKHKSHVIRFMYKKTNRTYNLRLTANSTALAFLENKQYVEFSHQHIEFSSNTDKKTNRT